MKSTRWAWTVRLQSYTGNNSPHERHVIAENAIHAIEVFRKLWDADLRLVEGEIIGCERGVEIFE